MSPRFRRVPPLPFASQRVTRRGGYLAQNLVAYNLNTHTCDYVAVELVEALVTAAFYLDAGDLKSA